MNLSGPQLFALIVMVPVGMVGIGAWCLAKRKHNERTAREEKSRKPWGYDQR